MSVARHISLLWVVALFFVTACHSPTPALLSNVPEGPPEYQQGWKDGCESGLTTYGNDWYKSFYSFKQDRKLVDNDTYFKVWQDAFNYCRHHVKRTLAAGTFFNEVDPSFRGSVFGDLRNQRNVVRNGFAPPTWNGLPIPGWPTFPKTEDPPFGVAFNRAPFDNDDPDVPFGAQGLSGNNGIPFWGSTGYSWGP